MMKKLLPEVVTKVYQIIFIFVLSLLTEPELFSLWSERLAELQSIAFFVCFIPPVYVVRNVSRPYFVFLTQVLLSFTIVAILYNGKDFEFSFVAVLCLISNVWFSSLINFASPRNINYIYSAILTFTATTLCFFYVENLRFLVPVSLSFFYAPFFYSRNLGFYFQIENSSDSFSFRFLIGFLFMLPGKYLVWLFPMYLFASKTTDLAYLGIFAGISAIVNSVLLKAHEFNILSDADGFLKYFQIYFVKLLESVALAVIGFALYGIDHILMISFGLFGLVRFFQLTSRSRQNLGLRNFSVVDTFYLGLFALTFYYREQITAVDYYMLASFCIFIFTFLSLSVERFRK